MKTKNIDPQSLKQGEVDESKNEIDPEVPQQKAKTGKKRKHVSALVAASMGRSAVSQTRVDSYDDVGFSGTGTNDTFHEE
jgi:hypothetical protein